MTCSIALWPIASSADFTALIPPSGVGSCQGDPDGTDAQYGRAWACFCLCPATAAPETVFRAIAHAPPADRLQ